MAKIQKVSSGGNEFDAFELAFDTPTEPWAEYPLMDGGRVRVRTTIQKMYRVVDNDGKPAYTPDGDPFIIVRHNIQITASE